ncbi:MAG TPA: tRNA lysidine(34) synthetase TilS [Candidatus Baltobacteraceae bacterium]|jgi:tRNA(Ile)-lysidine synthase|nr:tRNA lysidine(34) synthetase TilS [Candidatus Baltobacteraceae bacterium]
MRGNRPQRALEQQLLQSGILREGERLLIACSGGPDSVGLAALLHAVAETLDLQLTLGHVNHGTRGSAWQDEAVVLGLCAALGIRALVSNVAAARNDEASLRQIRYRALSGMAQKCGAGAVVTAHTAQDQTETVLLALFRGTGPAGLAGMPERRSLSDGVELLRPLLGFERATLHAYVLRTGLPYAVDPTNQDTGYRRNAVRQALEVLRPLFPGLDRAVSRAAGLVGEEAAGTPRASKRRELRDLLARHDALENVDLMHVAAAVRALEHGGSGRFHMAPGVELHVRDGAVSVYREEG